jgi:hypothetical protein
MFDPRFFINQTPPQGPDSRAKAVLHKAANSPRNSIRKSPKPASAASLKLRKQTILNEYLEFLRELEAIGETALARESGPWDGLIGEKTGGRKSRDTVPLINTVL